MSIFDNKEHLVDPIRSPGEALSGALEAMTSRWTTIGKSIYFATTTETAIKAHANSANSATKEYKYNVTMTQTLRKAQSNLLQTQVATTTTSQLPTEADIARTVEDRQPDEPEINVIRDRVNMAHANPSTQTQVSQAQQTPAIPPSNGPDTHNYELAA